MLAAVVPLLVVAGEVTLPWTEACQPISRTPAETAAEAILALVLTVRTSARDLGLGDAAGDGLGLGVFGPTDVRR